MGLFNLMIDLEGVTEMNRAFVGIDKEAVRDISDAWGFVHNDFKKETDSIFGAEGGFDGRPKWKPLSKGYGAWKKKHFPSAPILQLTGKLKASFEGGSGHVFNAGKQELEVGSSVEYGIYHQSNKPRGSNLPRRPMISFTKNQRTRWTGFIQAVIQKHINLQLAQNKPTGRVRI